MLRAFLTYFSKQARYILPVGVFIGVLLPDLAQLLRPLLVPVILVMLSGALLGLNWRALGAYGRRFGIGLGLFAWQLIASPLLVGAGTALLGLPPELSLALILNASAPPITANAVYAQLLDLDAPLAVYCIVLTTLLLPLTLAPVTAMLLESAMALDTGLFFLRVTAFIGGPFLIAAALRRCLGSEFIVHNAGAINGLNVLCLLIFAVAVMDGVSARLFADPAAVARLVIAAFTLNILLHVAGFIAFARAGTLRALSVAMCSGNRNMGLILAITTGVVGPDFAIYVGVAQLPMYCVPMMMAPIARRVVATDP